MIADLCMKHDVVCVADEVYEWMTYDNNKHIKIGQSMSPDLSQWKPICTNFDTHKESCCRKFLANLE